MSVRRVPIRGQSMTRAATRVARLVCANKCRCLLCGGPPGAFGFWEPDPETGRLFGVPRTKIATITYALCNKCIALPDVLARVENEILADLARAQ